MLLTYKVADGLCGPIIKPMMIDMGLSLAQIGLNVTIFGAVCALLGALLAGLMIRQFGLQSMFVCFAILQSLAIVYYVVLAYLFENHILFSQIRGILLRFGIGGNVEFDYALCTSAYGRYGFYLSCGDHEYGEWWAICGERWIGGIIRLFSDFAFDLCGIAMLFGSKDQMVCISTLNDE